MGHWRGETEARRPAKFSPILFATLLVLVSLFTLVDIPEEVSAYTPHGPIVIDGNAGFTPANGVVAGNGTWDDPFIIEGWEIDDPNNESIWINGTSAHVIIKDVYIHSGISNPYGGIWLWFSSNITVSNCLLVNNQHPLWLMRGRNHTVISNNISFNEFGLVIYFTDDVVVSNNTFWHNGIAIGTDRHEMIENLVITPDNMVNGKPVLYLVNQSGLSIRGVPVGQLLLANVTDSVVEDLTIDYTNTAIWGRGLHNVSFRNLTLSNNSFGIGFGNCHNEWPYCDDNVTVSGSRFAYNTYGMTVEFARDSSIHHNVLESNYAGIFSASLRDVSISSNDFSRNNQGLHMSGPLQGIRVRDNNISESTEGISVWASRHTDCNDTLVFHNMFLNNTQQAFEFIHYQVPNESCFQWDNGYPYGGNYWSDYSGTDWYRGPEQNIQGSDGIGDTPYPVLSEGIDRYPLVSPGTVYNRPPENVTAFLSGSNFENVTVTWDPSPDESIGLVDRYDILRGENFNASANLYTNIDSVPNGTHQFIDAFAGEGNPNTYFYAICAINMTNDSTCADNQAGKFTRPLSKGPNLISIPLVQSDESVGTVLQTVKYDKAWFYDSSSQEWKWYMKSKRYRRGLWNVNHTMGLWLNVTGNSNLTGAGIVPAQTTIRLHKGWNLVSFPSFLSYSISDLKAVAPVERVEAFDSSAPPYFLSVLADSDVLLAGQGYWVKTSEDATWVVSNT